MKWRCVECGNVLGVNQNGGLTLRYKDVEYVVTYGQIIAVCRRCKRTNIIQVTCEKQKMA